MKERDFLYGMFMLGIPGNEILAISRELAKGKLPSNVLDTIIENQDKIVDLHPDKWPWHPSAFDELAGGFMRVINTDKIWKDAQKYPQENYKESLPITTIDSEGTSGAVANLLEMYALTEYHDIKELSKIKEIGY